MKLTKERKIQEHFEGGDLRGFGKDAVLTDSYPYAYLAIKKTDPKVLEQVIQKHRLELVTSAHEGVNILKTRVRKENEHKLQSISLFAVAAEIFHAISPKSQARLGIVQQLHKVLEDGIKGEDPQENPYSTDNVISSWVKASLEGLAVDEGAKLALQQAGVSEVLLKKQTIESSDFATLLGQERTDENRPHYKKRKVS